MKRSRKGSKSKSKATAGLFRNTREVCKVESAIDFVPMPNAYDQFAINMLRSAQGVSSRWICSSETTRK